MGFPRSFFRAAVATASVSALIASGFALAGPASADPANPTPVSGTALPTAQVNGVVWAQTVSNGVDYVGGSFSQSQPAGAAAGVDVAPRANLFAYDVSTGAAAPGFSASTNAQVRGIAASQDGSVVYVVGDFTQVNGQPRNHIAALDRGGRLLPFSPNANGNVLAVSVRGSSVYFGGTFTAVDGVTRQRAAAVTAGGDLLPFAPNVADYAVRAVAISPDARTILLGGSFQNVNGQARLGLAALDSQTGANRPWATNSVIVDSGPNSAIYSLSSRGQTVYASGYVYGGDDPAATAYSNLEGVVAMNWSDGSVKWIEDCHGDSYSTYPFNDAVYVASHAHDCSNVVNGWTQTDPETWRRAQAFTQAPMGVLKRNTVANYADLSGRPSPAVVSGWAPKINTGTYTGLNQGAWSVAAGGSYVVFGGEFTTVDGARQTGLTRFQGQPEAPDSGLATPPASTPTPTPTPTPTRPAPPTESAPPAARKVPNVVSKPSAVALGPSRIAVKWVAPKAAKASKVTGYAIKAYKGSKVVASVTVGSTKRLATIGGLKKSTTYKIAVAARNKAGTGKASASASAKTKAKGENVSATKKPTKVKKPSASVAGAQIRVKWSAASVMGALGVSRYEVRVVLHGKTVNTSAVSSKSRVKTLTGLKRKTEYTVSVRAANWAGWGSWSAPTAARTR